MSDQFRKELTQNDSLSASVIRTRQSTKSLLPGCGKYVCLFNHTKLSSTLTRVPNGDLYTFDLSIRASGIHYLDFEIYSNCTLQIFVEIPVGKL